MTQREHREYGWDDDGLCDICGEPVQWRVGVDSYEVNEYGEDPDWAYACDAHLLQTLRETEHTNVEQWTGPEMGPFKPPTEQEMARAAAYIGVARRTAEYAPVMAREVMAIPLLKGAASSLTIPKFGAVNAYQFKEPSE